MDNKSINYYKIVAPDHVDYAFIDKLKVEKLKHPNEVLLLEYKNTKNISLYSMKRLLDLESKMPGTILIRVVGGYDQQRIDGYQHKRYVDQHKYDNIYTPEELDKILFVIDNIEEKIDSNWDPEIKLMYFISALKNMIIYSPSFEDDESKEIRSLRGFISKRTVCAGYALMLKELCDRNGIECQYVVGATKMSVHKAGQLNHAWNIVKIGDNYFPLDLTFNAGKSAKGRMSSIGDIANIDEFIYSHFPGKKEIFQKYSKDLRGIDGEYLNKVRRMIEKRVNYSSEIFGLTFPCGNYNLRVFQVQELMIDNEPIYKYVCFYEKDDKRSDLTIFYSKTNVLEVQRQLETKKVLERQLNTAKQNGNQKRIDTIEKKLLSYVNAEREMELIRKLLFSPKNMDNAEEYNDYYLGELSSSKVGSNLLDMVSIDPQFLEKFKNIRTKKMNQRLFKRSNGRYFVIEEHGRPNIGIGNPLYSYYVFEVNGKGDGLIKSVIFTDHNLMEDKRQGLADKFLSSGDIEKYVKEKGGYLGYLDSDGTRKFDAAHDEFFSKNMYSYYKMRSSNIKSYIEMISSTEIERIVQNYEISETNQGMCCVNKHDGKKVDDPLLVQKIQIAYVWINACNIHPDKYDKIEYAFKDVLRNYFDVVMLSMLECIKTKGNIDTYEIYKEVIQRFGFDAKGNRTQILLNLLNDEKNIRLFNRYFRRVFPTDVVENMSILPLGNEMEVIRKQLEESKKRLIELVEINGQVEFVQRRGK